MAEAPWTAEQCAKLNEFQCCGWVHEFTCGTKAKHAPGASSALVATPDGWACPSCDYRQTWAHGFMFNGAPPNPIEAFWKAPQEGVAIKPAADGEVRDAQSAPNDRTQPHPPRRPKP